MSIPVMSKTQQAKLEKEISKLLTSNRVTDPDARRWITVQVLAMCRLSFVDGIGAYIDLQIQKSRRARERMQKFNRGTK